MKKLLALFVFLGLFAAGCKSEKKIITFKAPAPAAEPLSPSTTTIEAKEHTPFTVTAKVIPAGTAPITTYWIWKGKIAGYGNSVTITPSEEDGGKSITLEFYAIQNKAISELKYNVDVAEVNDPPVITSYSPEATAVITRKGKTLSFSIIAEDPDSNISYKWLINDKVRGYGKTFTLSVDDSMDGKNFIIKSVITDGENEAEHSWNLVVEHYDFPPEIKLPLSTMFLSQEYPVSYPKTRRIVDLSKYVTDKDNNLDQLSFSFETPSGVGTFLEGYWLGLTVPEQDMPPFSIKIKVSDGEKLTKKIISFVNDDYLFFKNESVYSLGAVGLETQFSASSVTGSESSTIISDIAIGRSYYGTDFTISVVGITTLFWGTEPFYLLKYNPLSLQLTDTIDISQCSSFPYNLFISQYLPDMVFFTNLKKFSDGSEKLSLFNLSTGQCETYPLTTTNDHPNMSYEGITGFYNYPELTLYIAGTGYQYTDYSTWKSIYDSSYLTMVTYSTDTGEFSQSYHFKVSNCTNLQSVLSDKFVLYAVCTGDYSYSVIKDEGYLIKFSIENGYPVEITRVAIGVGTHPAKIKIYNPSTGKKKPVGSYLLTGSASGKLFIIEDTGSNLSILKSIDFNMGPWTSVNPVVITTYNDTVEAGAVASPWGSNAKLFLSSDLLSTPLQWDYEIDLGDKSPSNWVKW